MGGITKPKDDDSTVQRELDRIIEEMKKNRPRIAGSNTLPLPMRFTAKEVQKLSLSFIGSLSFYAQYDTQVFSANFFDKKMLRRGLTEAGFIS